MMLEKKALVLGGTAAHIALLKELKRRGYRTVLVDYYPNPVAKPYADLHVQESTLDFDKVVELAREHEVDLVISACVDQANVAASYAMEKIGKVPPYSYEVAKRISNKGDMKRAMNEQGIPTARYLYVEGISDVDLSNLRFPVVVKPADCCGAAGVKKCETEEQLEKYLPFAIECSRNDRALIEEFVSGIEISAYCFVSNKRAKVLATAERLSVIDGDAEVIKCYGTIMPSSLSEAAIRAVEDAATKVAQAYGLDNTPLHIQALVDDSREQDKINIIEFAPRVGGGLSYRTIWEKTGFDIISATVDSWEGKQVSVYVTDEPIVQIVHLIYARPGEFEKIDGMDLAVKTGLVDTFFPYKTKGMHIGETTASAGRVGAFIVSGSSCEDILDKLAPTFSGISVQDRIGNDLTCRDFILGEEEITAYKNRRSEQR